MLDYLKKSIWSELGSGKAVDIYRRNLQNSYVDALIPLLGNTNLATLTFNRNSSDASGIARVHLLTLKSEISKAIRMSSGVTKAHYIDLLAKITEALNPKNSSGDIAVSIAF